MLAQTGVAAEKLSIPKIFGATDEDADSLRIVSLYEVPTLLMACLQLKRLPSALPLISFLDLVTITVEPDECVHIAVGIHTGGMFHP